MMNSMGPVQMQLLLSGTASPRFFSGAAAATYYDLLEVEPTADTTAIKAAFRQKAKTCHPDVLDTSKLSKAEFAERTTEFQALNEAFAVLSSDILRRQYDRKVNAGGPGAVHDFDADFDGLPQQHVSMSEASERGTQFVEKDTNQISQWYVGQKAMTKDQIFFYKRLEKYEKKHALEESKAARHIKIKPLSRGRSLIWLGTPLFLAGIWGYNAVMAYNSE
eukprot:CAMPEP_0195512434 /NCGR_PEP_ID=MMETSP0794_2-20130614/4388_1 /TAXON_ID=515487 /ORGANISM="Stephanopyxis turris, Strain CCMP 815" /LENGTH=219 /DNA_ID=CAMNT_0040640211 /DNA_START=104 /DNA_END=763 /DNA_ORIENTATION=-